MPDEDKQEVTQPGPSPQEEADAHVDADDAKRQAQIRADDAERRAEAEGGLVVRKPLKGEGGTSFDYGDPSPESDYAKEDVVYDPKNPGGESFDYGGRP